MKKWLETDSFEEAFEKFNDNMEEIEQNLTEPLILENLIKNGDFSDGTSGWKANGDNASDVQVDNNILSWQPKVANAFSSSMSTNKYIQIDTLDKLYLCFNGVNISQVFYWTVTAHLIISVTGMVDGFNSVLFNPKDDNRGDVSFYGKYIDKRSSISNVSLLNLTQTFGAGNEPTKEQMDELMKVVPNQWWDGELTLEQKEVVQWLLKLEAEKADKQQEAWITPTLLNGWTSQEGLQYRKNQFGQLEFKGRINPPTETNITFMVLPPGYRPLSVRYINFGGSSFVAFLPSGQVQSYFDSWLSLDNITISLE